MKPGHCFNCGGPCDVPCIDNTGEHYLGCRSCTVMLAGPIWKEQKAAAKAPARPKRN
jgi:hypothetical protein